MEIQSTQRPGTEAIVREIPPEERDAGRLCWAAFPGAYEEKAQRCDGAAAVEVYGLPFCEIHGAEIRAGALAEFYFDAQMFLERLDNPGIPEPNPAALGMLRTAVAELSEAVHEANKADDAALLRAYPLRRELMDEDFRAFDYADPEQSANGTPEDWCRDHRLLLHKLVRLAHEQGAAYVVEALEKHRGHVSEQLAYVMADYAERASRRTS